MKVIEKIFNIAEHEVPRTVYAWALLFLHRLGLIIGTTTLIAMFVAQFGINQLPIMVLLQAVLTIIGMMVYSFLNQHFSSKQLIPSTAFIAGVLLFVSTFFVDQVYVFFGLLLSVTGVFLPQLTIFLSNYIEDFFTPLECERTFPVIESAHTIGGIFGGLLITALSVYIGSYKFFYLWILLLFLGVSVIFFLEPFSSEHRHIFHKQEQIKKDFRSRVKIISHGFNEMRANQFLQGLFVIFLLHWIIAHVLEFQYTKLVDEAVEATGGSHQEGLAHGLGSFHMLFYGCALVVQLFVASRIFRKLGTVGSFLLHGLVTFFSSVSLLLGFGYFTVILAKNNFELSGIVHKNAYDASYYALKHGSQRQVRELFDAFVYPVGTILGTLVVLFVQFFFLSEHAFFTLQIALVALTIAMIIFAFKLQSAFTSISKRNLLDSHEGITKFHAIEILSQKGHQNHLGVLIQTLKNSHEMVSVKMKILEIFHKLAEPKTIPVLIEFLHADDVELVYGAVHALSGFSKLGENVFDQAFSRYLVITELKKLFKNSTHEKIREAIIRTLAALKYEKIVPFLLKVLQNGSQKLQIASIQVCDLFHDPALSDYLLPCLKSHSPFVRAQAVLALWQFPSHRKKLQSVLHHLYYSNKREDFLAYCSVIGDVGTKADLPKLLSHFDVLDPVLKMTMAYAIFKLGNDNGLQVIVNLLFSRNLLVLDKAKDLFYSLKPDQKKLLQSAIQREASQRLQPLFSLKSHQSGPESIQSIVQRCKDAYIALDLRGEAEHIHSLFESFPANAFVN